MSESLPGKSLLESLAMEEPGQWALESISTPLLHQRLFATYHFLAYEGKYSSSDLTCKYHQQASKELQRKENLTWVELVHRGCHPPPHPPQDSTAHPEPHLLRSLCTGLPRQISCHIQTKGKWQRCASEGVQENQRVIPGNTSQGTGKARAPLHVCQLCSNMVAAESRETGLGNKRTQEVLDCKDLSINDTKHWMPWVVFLHSPGPGNLLLTVPIKHWDSRAAPQHPKNPTADMMAPAPTSI